jgi:serine/threonine protein phosphatase 1
MPARVIAIGDIHGCARALDALLAAIEPTEDDVFISLGDHIDRGPDSRAVVQRLIELGWASTVRPVLGNHDQMLLDALADPSRTRYWLMCGGDATLRSYGVAGPEEIPADHLDWLRDCLDYVELDTHFFAHASYFPEVPLAQQPPLALRWESIRDELPAPHVSGKVAVVGHTSQKSGEVLHAGHLICLDTYCYGGKWLTAYDVRSGRTWQASRTGTLRR